MEERRWQEQKEFEERKWREELELKRNEQKYRESTAVKVKTWGDALRNVICKARLRGLSAEVVPAEIVRVRMKMAQGKGFSNVTCAVVENLNYSLILGSDVVEKLNVKMYEENLMLTMSLTFSTLMKKMIMLLMLMM